MTQREEWRAIPGAPGYEVSNYGRVMSYVHKSPRLLQPVEHTRGYHRIRVTTLEGGSRKIMVHRLVCLAFIGPCPDGMEVRHLDGDTSNDCLANLAYGTKSENAQDVIRHGHNERVLMTACRQGHPYTPENTHWKTKKGRPRPYRHCRKCGAAAQRRRMARRGMSAPVTLTPVAVGTLGRRA